MTDELVILIYVTIDANMARHMLPPLGLIYLGTVLRVHGITTRIFDFQHETASWSAVEKAVSDAKHCMVGFSCDSNNIYRVLHLSDRLLSRFPDLKIVLGGPHVTHRWEPYVAERRIIVRGEGEYPLLLLAEHFLRGKGGLRDIPGIAYCMGSKVCSNPISMGLFEDVDAIPFPDYTFLDPLEKYIPAVVTGRGCNHRCYFCSEGSQNHRLRQRSIQKIEEELRALKAFHHGRIPYLFFTDDTFTISPRRVHELCDVLDRIFPDKSRFSFFCGGRVDILAKHPELIYRLKKAGLLHLQIGIESSDRTIKD